MRTFRVKNISKYFPIFPDQKTTESTSIYILKITFWILIALAVITRLVFLIIDIRQDIPLTQMIIENNKPIPLTHVKIQGNMNFSLTCLYRGDVQCSRPLFNVSYPSDGGQITQFTPPRNETLDNRGLRISVIINAVPDPNNQLSVTVSDQYGPVDSTFANYVDYQNTYILSNNSFYNIAVMRNKQISIIEDGWANLGFPRTEEKYYISSVSQSSQRIAFPNDFPGTFCQIYIYANTPSTLTTYKEVRKNTVLFLLSSMGGFMSLLFGIYVFLLGVNRISPWGLFHKFLRSPPDFSDKSNKLELFLREYVVNFGDLEEELFSNSNNVKELFSNSNNTNTNSEVTTNYVRLSQDM